MGYTELLNNIIISLITIGLPLLIGAIFKYLNTIIGVERVAKIKEEIESATILAEAAVIYVQQKFPDFKGEEKYDKALEWLMDELNKAGLQFTKEMLEGYIESAVKIAKDSFGENWKNS